MKLFKWFIPLCLALAAASCNSTHKTDAQSFDQIQSPIVNGRLVTGDDYLATTMLGLKTSEAFGEEYIPEYGEFWPLCSSTLITPNFVLTAAHCICDSDGDNETFRKGMHVNIAQSVNDIRHVYDIDSFYPHPDYDCDGETETLDADIAIVKLKTPVPLDIVHPIAPLPPSLAITADEVDSADGMTVVDVGFGTTNDPDDPDGHKHEMMSVLYSYCTQNDKQSKHCADPIPSEVEENGQSYIINFELSHGFMYTRRGQGAHSSTCPGDSGGPMFITRNDIPYVAGVHSHVSTYECNLDSVAGSTIVTDNYDFIRNVVTDLPADTPETNCNDGKDDNNDGRIDCNDPWCFHIPVCLPEKCDDKIDNNGNGLIDCDDDECADAVICKPEICDDKIDNNDNGKIDCDDPQCADADACKKEICNDKIDNDGDDKIDCDDDDCADSKTCKPEICDDKIDNNGNGLIDCGDPQCADSDLCAAVICDCSDLNCKHAKCIEICDDNIDNNGDGKSDCNDPRCAGAVQCNTEICGDNIDNNGDGIIDCDDPVCVGLIQCNPEICDDKIDNNGNGKVDCDDPACEGRYACNPFTPNDDDSDSDSACSALVRNPSNASGWLWLIAALAALGCRRIRSRS